MNSESSGTSTATGMRYLPFLRDLVLNVILFSSDVNDSAVAVRGATVTSDGSKVW